jgi:hypothetical protein
MAVPGLLRPVVAALTWPVSGFDDVRRTYDVALVPSDARAVVRGAIGTDPYFLPVMDGIRAIERSGVVGSVDDDGRLQIYVGGRKATGIGLLGRVSALGQGSRIVTRVGWIGQHWWHEPLFTFCMLCAAGTAVYTGATATDAVDAGLALLFAAMIAGGRLLDVRGRAQLARNDELPLIFECLERVLSPHGHQPPADGGGSTPLR